MVLRYCLEIRSKKRFNTRDLYDEIKMHNANLIDLGKHVYVTGVAPYYSFCAVLEKCLAYGVVECEVGEK